MTLPPFLNIFFSPKFRSKTSPQAKHHKPSLLISLFPAGGGGGARPWPGFLLLPTDPQNQHKVQKISSLWFDFSPFCLWWTSRQSVFVFSSWARVGGSFERSGSRTGDFCSPTPPGRRCPVLHTLVRRPGIQNNASGLEGGTKVNQREKHLLLIFKSHAYVCERRGVSRGWLLGRSCTTVKVHGPDRS